MEYWDVMASSNHFNDTGADPHAQGVQFFAGTAEARAGEDKVAWDDHFDDHSVTHAVVDGIQLNFIHREPKDLVVEWNKLHNALPPDLRSETAVQELNELCTKNRHLFDNTQVARQIKEICEKWCASDRKNVDIVRQDLENLRQSIEHMLTGTLDWMYD